MVEIKKIPEAPRDPSLSINAPRPVVYSSDRYIDKAGMPRTRTYVTKRSGKAELTGGPSAVYPPKKRDL
jgi:hypothetical protein